ncbi:hypothetical protein GCM10025875_08510 [Litorihabitans aurantiacus]|uniref:Uncharacterized protein n=1 Tax=Litorihabitans aurantiacus TaxID=1930061 RepID=A0AA37UMU2_9MICO|nr:hypothetical protein GCM10025875_08510 [Litorihabitans aurantiacus]
MVLDEPTAHLSADDERAVVAAVRALADAGAAVVVIAHRPAMLAAADDVVSVHTLALDRPTEDAETDAVHPERTRVDGRPGSAELAEPTRGSAPTRVLEGDEARAGTTGRPA